MTFKGCHKTIYLGAPWCDTHNNFWNHNRPEWGIGSRGSRRIKGASPSYWKHLQDEAKKIGWRGELDVVKFLRKRRWYAKRAYGSWGPADVFAARGWLRETDPDPVAYLIDVKSSDSIYRGFDTNPRQDMTIKESKRTGLPAIRAAVLKNGKPLIKWFWYHNGSEIPLDWFD